LDGKGNNVHYTDGEKRSRKEYARRREVSALLLLAATRGY